MSESTPVEISQQIIMELTLDKIINQILEIDQNIIANKNN